MSNFHCSGSKYEVGHIIYPGNWGNIILKTGNKHEWWNSEQILEEVRLEQFSNKPSRLNSTFSCETISTMRAFMSKSCPNNFIYRIEIVDLDAPVHKGDFNAVMPLPAFAKSMREIAELYWQYKLKTKIKERPEVECSEIVSSSPLRVLEIIE